MITYTPWNMVDLKECILNNDMEGAKKLIDQDDLSAINSARASFNAESTTISKKDEKLISFLAEASPVPHSSPFRHAHITFEINCPIIIARQWFRHVIGASTVEEGTPWSELSRRYVRGNIVYHVPSSYRTRPENAKQGSGGPLPLELHETVNALFTNACETAVENYEKMLDLGVAPEQARMVLPQGVYTSFRWSPSIQTIANFLIQRNDGHAQEEIRLFADAVKQLSISVYPLSTDAFCK
jgi:thymidylate synthase (FAD)